MSNNVITFPEAAGLVPKRRAVPIANEPEDEAPIKSDWRSRECVQRGIDEHKACRDRYAKAVAWLAAAEAENLPPANIEAARQEQVVLYGEMQASARNLLICMPTDPKALVDLLLYLERNFSVLPQEIMRGGGAGESLAFYLLRTVRLSLRPIARYGKGKHGPTS